MNRSGRPSRRSALAAAGVMCAVALVPAAIASCTSSPPPGELFIAVDTNVELPKNIDNVELDVQEANSTDLHSYKFAYPLLTAQKLGLPYSQLPSTLGVVSGAHAGETVTVTLYGNLQNTRVFQRAVTTIVPTDRTAILRLVLDGLCLGGASVASDGMSTVCSEGQSCVAGGCAAALVDPDSLDTFTTSSAYANGDAGACFSLATCFQTAPADRLGFEPVTKDPATGACTIPYPTNGSGAVDEASLNIAVPADGALCTTSPCLVPLDHVTSADAPLEGWTRTSAGVIQLPDGVCSPTHGAPTTAVLVSTACVVKTVNNPLCGAWDSVTTPEPTADGGALQSSTDGGVVLADGSVSFGDGGGSGGEGDATVPPPPEDDGGVPEIDGSVAPPPGDGGQMSGSDGGTTTTGDASTTMMCDAGANGQRLCMVAEDADVPIMTGKAPGAGER